MAVGSVVTIPAVRAAADAPFEGDLGWYRTQFPVTQDFCYLNTASVGAPSTRVVEAIGVHAAEQARRGSAFAAGWEADIERVRGRMAAFVHADPDEIAITLNTAAALSILAAGLDWRPGDRVVISDQEFPANAHPWRALAARGVETVVVRSVGGRVPLDAVLAEVRRPKTRLVALSWVEFSTGYRNDLRTIAEACHARGALLCADAIQGLGALRLDVRELDIDFFGAGSQKWLLGPPGVGWLYCRRALVEHLTPMALGQGSFARIATDPWLAYERPLWGGARRFEPGFQNVLGLAGLEAALDLLDEVGIERIEAHNRALSDRLADGLIARGFRLAAPRDGGQWSPIVSFRSERFSAADLFDRLTARHVLVSLREGLVRAATHFFNDDEDLDRLFAALPG